MTRPMYNRNFMKTPSLIQFFPNVVLNSKSTPRRPSATAPGAEESGPPGVEEADVLIPRWSSVPVPIPRRSYARALDVDGESSPPLIVRFRSRSRGGRGGVPEREPLSRPGKGVTNSCELWERSLVGTFHFCSLVCNVRMRHLASTRCSVTNTTSCVHKL